MVEATKISTKVMKEIKAIKEIETGNKSEAKVIFSELADDENAPERLRVRAAEFLKTLQ